jgi:hypothetical protein
MTQTVTPLMTVTLYVKTVTVIAVWPLWHPVFRQIYRQIPTAVTLMTIFRRMLVSTPQPCKFQPAILGLDLSLWQTILTRICGLLSNERIVRQGLATMSTPMQSWIVLTCQLSAMCHLQVTWTLKCSCRH